MENLEQEQPGKSRQLVSEFNRMLV
jgi:hypothetical protein